MLLTIKKSSRRESAKAFPGYFHKGASKYSACGESRASSVVRRFFVRRNKNPRAEFILCEGFL